MSDLDCYELLLVLLGLDDNAADDEIQEKLYDEYGVEIDEFKKLAGKLMDYAHIAKSPLNNTWNVGFADHANGRFITMKECASNPK